jgi:N-acetylmuramoyl-L-alanine amidase
VTRSLTALPLVAALLVALAGGGEARGANTEPGGSEVLTLSSDLRIRVLGGSRIELEVLAAEGEGYAEIAARACGLAAHGDALKAWNEDAAVEPGTRVRVPLALLTPELRGLVLRSLFPQDRREGTDWVHIARSGRLPTYAESLWQVAQWFTGDGKLFARLQEVNGLASPELAAGQAVRIPIDVLHEAFVARGRSDDGKLEYGSDDRGPYAGYRLRPGEALYSAVVVRYTGRSSSEDVGALAERLASRSGIKDLRDIPVGFLVKIPFEVLEPEFLPAGHPRRKEAEAARAQMARELKQRPVEGTRGGLEGVLIVIDPGHGGRDLGTQHNGIWEHDYVYDISCRLKQRLERETAAKIVMTLEDRQTGCAPSKGDRLRANQQGTILTDPPFLAKREGEHRIGVNLRWYLANAVYRDAVRQGTKKDRVVFLSIHADARHRSLRGAMVYVPGARYRTGSYRHTSKTYKRYKEVRESPVLKFSSKDRVRSEAVSRKLADSIVKALRHGGLPVQEHKPVRDRIIRGKKTYVPAVIRANAIPAKVLVELVNISNKQDAKLLASARRRAQMADALFSALHVHFGEKAPERSATRAAN